MCDKIENLNISGKEIIRVGKRVEEREEIREEKRKSKRKNK